MKTKQLTADVLVVGAGISGVAAAISASRCQANTILIEKNSSFGGIVQDCQHNYLCGLSAKNTGITQEIICALKKLSSKNRFTRLGRLLVFSFRPKDLRTVLRKLLQKEKNLKIFYNHRLTKVKRKDNLIVSLETSTGSLNFKPKVVIDASGEGEVIKLSGAKYQSTPLIKQPLAGFTFEIRPIIDQSNLLTIKVPYYLSVAVKQKKIPAYFKFTNFVYSHYKNTGIIKLSLPAEYATKQTTNTKKIATFIHTYLRNVLSEFKKSRIIWVAKNIHAREGLHLDGKHLLTRGEVLSAKKFPDAIAKGYWPIEFWHPKYGQKIKYLKTNKFYQIPLRSLYSKNITNLLATGKCISATSEALASSRVSGTCIYLGEAAGRAAAQ